MKKNYVKPEKKSVLRKRQILSNGIRFIKRMTNVPALPGQDKFNLGGKLIKEILDQGLFKAMIGIFEYGLKNREKKITIEAIEAIYNISKFGKMESVWDISVGNMPPPPGGGPWGGEGESPHPSSWGHRPGALPPQGT